MILYRCTECGDDIGHAFRLTACIETSSTEHHSDVEFCSIGCLTDWAAECGYRDDDREF
jgi:hypothetical protein